MSYLKLQFRERESLADSVLIELEKLKISNEDEIDFNFGKNLICRLFTSVRVKSAANKLLGRCTIDGERVTDKYKETDEFMEDYLEVFTQILIQTVSPFLSKAPAIFESVVTYLNLNNESNQDSE